MRGDYLWFLCYKIQVSLSIVESYSSITHSFYYYYLYLKKQTNNNYNNYDSSETDPLSNLQMTVSALPKLQRRKQLIDIHTSMAMALLNLIKKRQIDALYLMEESIQRQVKHRYSSKEKT